MIGLGPPWGNYLEASVPIPWRLHPASSFLPSLASGMGTQRSRYDANQQWRRETRSEGEQVSVVSVVMKVGSRVEAV